MAPRENFGTTDGGECGSESVKAEWLDNPGASYTHITSRDVLLKGAPPEAYPTQRHLATGPNGGIETLGRNRARVWTRKQTQTLTRIQTWAAIV